MANDLIVWRKNYIRWWKPPKPPHKRTICEVLRELAREAQARGDKLSLHKIEEAHDMAKRMQRKLTYYNKNERFSSIVDVDGVVGNG